MAKKIENPAAEALKRAKAVDKTTRTWVEYHNALFGIGGLFVGLFPTQAERTAFTKTDEYKEIVAMLEAKQEDDSVPVADASGNFLLRLPRSIHAALVEEAVAEGVSLNQLCLAKLTIQLRASVRMAAG